MIDYNSFGVVGGDRRQIALAESIASDGYTVYAFGFDTINFQKGVIKAELDEIAAKCENIILPLPVTADGKYLNTHYRVHAKQDGLRRHDGKAVPHQ